jgi:hypothetical protein
MPVPRFSPGHASGSFRDPGGRLPRSSGEAEASVLRASQGKSKIRLILALAYVAFGSGCVTSGALSDRNPTGSPLPTVAVVSSDGWAFEWGTRNVAEKNLATCLAEELSKARKDLRVVFEAEFLAAAFPYLPPGCRPRKARSPL